MTSKEISNLDMPSFKDFCFCITHEATGQSLLLVPYESQDEHKWSSEFNKIQNDICIYFELENNDNLKLITKDKKTEINNVNDMEELLQSYCQSKNEKNKKIRIDLIVTGTSEQNAEEKYIDVCHLNHQTSIFTFNLCVRLITWPILTFLLLCFCFCD